MIWIKIIENQSIKIFSRYDGLAKNRCTFAALKIRLHDSY